MPIDDKSGNQATGSQDTPKRRNPHQRSAGGGTGRPGAPQQGPSNDDERRRQTTRRLWHVVSYVVIGLVALYFFQQYVLAPISTPSTKLEYSDFKAKIVAGQVLTAVIGQSAITCTLKSPDPSVTKPVDFKTNNQLGTDKDLVPQLEAAKVTYSFSGAGSPIGGILISLLPFLLIGVVWVFIYRRMAGAAGRGGPGGIFGVGKSKATKVEPEKVGVTFKDVGGADEAIAELH